MPCLQDLMVYNLPAVAMEAQHQVHGIAMNKEDRSMKKNSITNLKFTSLAILLIAGTTLTACSTDEDNYMGNTGQDTPKTYVFSVNATKGGINTVSGARATRALSLSGSTLNATWATTEKVYVIETVGTTEITLEGYISPTSNGTDTRLNGTISGLQGELPKKLKLQFPRSDYSYVGQLGTLDDIATNFDYATATANVDEIGTGKITATEPVTFANQQAIVKFTIQDASSNPLLVSSLRISAKGLKADDTDDTRDITVTPASATNELYIALKDISDTRIMLTAVISDQVYAFNKNGVTFTNGKYYEYTIKMKVMTEGITLASATKTHVGWVVGQNGKIYSSTAKATAASTTAVAMIAYVGNESDCTHGLAIALNDESGEMLQSDASSAAVRHTAITDCTWRLPSLKDWQYMLIGCNNGASYIATPGNPEEVNIGTLDSKLISAGGASSKFVQGNYWASDDNCCPNIDSPNVNLSQTASSDERCRARACLAF